MSENTAAPTSERAPAAANAPQAASPALPPPDAPSPTPRRLLGLRGDIVTAAALALLTAAALILGEESVGFTRDEGVYFEAGRRYAAWFIDDFSEHGLSALKDEVIRRRFEFNREHPALMKSLFGLSERLFSDALGLTREALGFRLPAILLSALLSAVLFLFGRHVTSRRGALFAVLAFWLVPRTFFHGALACFDMPIAFAWLLTVAAYRRATRHPTARSLACLGLAFGLTLSIKHNAWIIPGVLLIHWALTELVAFAHSRDRKRLTASLRPFAAMLLLGPLTLFATWPFLWHAPLDRFLWYARFHTGHINYPWEFLGQLLVEAPFPPGYALVVTALTVPAAILALMTTGALSDIARFVATYLFVPLKRLFFIHHAQNNSIHCTSNNSTHRAQNNSTDGVLDNTGHQAISRAKDLPKSPLCLAPLDSDSLLLLGNAFASLFVFSMPFIPVFGGVKHWLPAMPFLCLFAARALERIAQNIETALNARAPNHLRRLAPLTWPTLAALVLLPALVGLVRIHPYGTSFYNEIARGPAGAATLGMHRQYWSNNVTGVFDWINQNAPQNAQLYLHEVTAAAFRAYQQNGMLRGDLQFSPSIARSQIAAYQYMPEFRDIEFQIWNHYGTQTPVTGLYIDETPQIIVYQRTQ